MRYLLPLITSAVLVFSVPVHAEEKNSTPSSMDDLSYDKRLSGYEYPFDVKTFSFDSQNQKLEMTYMYLPAKGDKPVVTLLHGKNFNGAYWEQTAQFLQDQGYGVLMPDQIGFGKSSKPTGYQYSFPVLANNTRELMKSLDIEKAVIVGHSMGGMLASRFALNYPSATEKLVLVNPIGLENYLRFVQYKDVGFFYQSELKKTPEKITAYQKKNYYAGDWNDRYAALTEPLVGWVQGPDWKDLAYVSALTYDMIFTQPVVEEYDDLDVPAALILGTRDRTGPGRNWKKDGVEYELGRYDQLGRAIRARNEDIQLYELSDLGHLPQIEAFDRFKEVFAKALP
ncbi:alpha/beta fold hydrolase [Marinobacter fonticola]|uniref:alpha/beta fold hydrolase n=1 Tax=Marinobacter fonticola TaxID=2603215 RepID=UPI0011E60E8B|nr:alpha/beta hydrolase [Marinobacter fonticola]